VQQRQPVHGVVVVLVDGLAIQGDDLGGECLLIPFLQIARGAVLAARLRVERRGLFVRAGEVE